MSILWMVFACSSPEPEKDSTVAIELIESGTVHFVAIGDAGTGNEHQFAVASAVETVCAEKGCDFALYLGDNFYEVGVNGVDDPQFHEKFELPYSNLDFPFYAVLGNHDYGQLGVMWEPPTFQVQYSDVSDKWTMPDRYYSASNHHISLYGLDTNAIIWDGVFNGATEQGDWLDNELENSNTLWKIAFGHHPYISNGLHGVAGEYDGLPPENPMAGVAFDNFVQAHLCGQVDVYFSGHDHDLQWLEPKCGVEWVVSGAGGKKRSEYDWSQPTRFEAYDTYGFVWVEIVDNVMSLSFYNEEGTVLYEGQITK